MFFCTAAISSISAKQLFAGQKTGHLGSRRLVILVMLCRMHHRNNYPDGTEMAAAQKYIEAGERVRKSWNCLWERLNYCLVLRLGTSCGSSPSPECLIFLSKDMVQGLRKTWVLRPDMVSNSANYWPYPSQAPTPDFKVYTYTTQISINILGTENFHRKPPAAGLSLLITFGKPDLFVPVEHLYFMTIKIKTGCP